MIRIGKEFELEKNLFGVSPFLSSFIKEPNTITDSYLYQQISSKSNTCTFFEVSLKSKNLIETNITPKRLSRLTISIELLNYLVSIKENEKLNKISKN